MIDSYDMAFFIALYIVGMKLNDILNIIYLKRT
jgi:hypothetical protein